jgi:MFS family permease
MTTTKGSVATFLPASLAPSPSTDDIVEIGDDRRGGVGRHDIFCKRALHQVALGLTPFILTVIFAAYVLSVLMALLTVGSLSDHIGRRPAILAALALNGAAMAPYRLKSCPVGEIRVGFLCQISAHL